MPFDAIPVNSGCMLCPVQNCLSRRGDASQAAAFAAILEPRQAVMPEQGELHRAGEALRSVYSVRGGCIKAYALDRDGKERIRGFYFAGDLIGLDALGDGLCLSSAAAVVPSQVCVAPLSDLRELMRRRPEIAQRMIEQTSRELALSLAWAGDFSAEQRLAAFLMYLRNRMNSGCVVRPPMGQREIGSYLRLATETVCRTLKALERSGSIATDPRGIRILNEGALRAYAEPVGILEALQLPLAA
jgi:CRP/FNR family transcriptional regulator